MAQTRKERGMRRSTARASGRSLQSPANKGRARRVVQEGEGRAYQQRRGGWTMTDRVASRKITTPKAGSRNVSVRGGSAIKRPTTGAARWERLARSSELTTARRETAAKNMRGRRAAEGPKKSTPVTAAQKERAKSARAARAQRRVLPRQR